jgi:chemotaxis protein CheY-P-specific phosphatase CheC
MAMPVSELGQLLFDAAAEVLETMFFTTVVGDAAAEVSNAQCVSVRLSFHGNPSGRFGVRVPLETGRKMAESFLGTEDESPSEAQIGEVVCELANMLCGSLLSRLGKGTRFELSSPEIDPQETGCPEEGTRINRVLEVDSGTLGVWLEFVQAL